MSSAHDALAAQAQEELWRMMAALLSDCRHGDMEGAELVVPQLVPFPILKHPEALHEATQVETRIYPARACRGEGTTPEQAMRRFMADWGGRYDISPGSTIYWRARPEVTAVRLFDRDETVFRCYSRHAIMPK